LQQHVVLSWLGSKPLVSRARAILSQAEPFNGSWLETAQERFKLFSDTIYGYGSIWKCVAWLSAASHV
jgi:hypothetical protein